jgi:hypothetical protein
MMMHSCNLVQINLLEDKLPELIPIAEQALLQPGTAQSIKLTALQLFRKILCRDESMKIT